MIHEKSTGVITFRMHPKEGLQYLVLYHRGAYWNFPKGRVEQGESETEAALRELQEETGIDKVKIIDGWRQQTAFFFKEDRGNKKELIKKDFVLYLAEASMDARVNVLNYDRHNGYAWLDFKTACKYLRFKGLKEIMAEADSFIQSKLSKK